MLDNAIPQGFEDAVELRRKNRETVVKYMNTKGQDRLRRHELFVEDGCATQAPVCKLLASASPCVEAASTPINCELMISRPFLSSMGRLAYCLARLFTSASLTPAARAPVRKSPPTASAARPPIRACKPILPRLPSSSTPWVVGKRGQIYFSYSNFD